tara:strand:- start:3 stop:218 length:216 start_codon:yes stop_codon:yes gene_type:complete
MKTNKILKPVKFFDNVDIKLEQTIYENGAWTAALPQGELSKLKKVCKPIATKQGVTIWILDKTKAVLTETS